MTRNKLINITGIVYLILYSTMERLDTPALFEDLAAYRWGAPLAHDLHSVLPVNSLDASSRI